jgi:hypothetical protein
MGYISTNQRALKQPRGLAHGLMALGTDWPKSHWCDGGLAGSSLAYCAFGRGVAELDQGSRQRDRLQ